MRLRLVAVGSTRYKTGTSGIGWRMELMFLDATVSFSLVVLLLAYVNSQVYRNAPAPQVVDPQHA